MTRSVTYWTLCMAPAWLCASCDARPSSDPAAAIRVDTLANGAIHVVNPESGVWSDDGWRLVEDLRIGALDSDSAATFGRISGLEVDRLGRIWVIDLAAREVRVFDRDGRHVRTIGRAGGGPGEFTRPVAIHQRGDGSVWVVDMAARLYTLFDTAGAYVASLRRNVSGRTSPRTEGFDTAGMLLEMDVLPGSGLESRAVLLRVDADGAITDTIAVPEFEEEEYEVFQTVEGGTARYASHVPFTGRLVWRADRRGHLWHGITSAYRLMQTSPRGDTLRIVERQSTPIPVTSADRSEALDAMVRLRDMGARIDESRIPANKPAFEDFLVDDAGYLWVQPVVAGEDLTDGVILSAFDVFDPDGGYLGRVRSPVPLATNPTPGQRLPPLIRGPHVYGVHVDTLGVQSVVRLRIEGRS